MVFNLEEGGIYLRFGWNLGMHRCGSEDNRLHKLYILSDLIGASKRKG